MSQQMQGRNPKSLGSTLRTYDPLSNGCEGDTAWTINTVIEDKVTFKEQFPSGIENKMSK